jgi:hypothetical protein
MPNDEVRRAFMDSIAPWGKIVALLDSPHPHVATEETLVLLKKIREFWKLVEESLVIYPRESLQ